MNDTSITVRGYVGGDVVVRAAAETHVANFRLAATPRVFNRATEEWGDGATQWYSITAWRQLGLNVAKSLRKGHPVVVTGRLTVKEWTDQHGILRTTLEIDADHVGHDLVRGSSVFVRNERPQEVERASEQAARGEAAVAPADLSAESGQPESGAAEDPVRDWRAA